MNKHNFFSKAVTWLLITALVNPAMMTPAFARDTDIFLSTTAGSTTAEPNVMIVLDTSDSMNYFEGWTEYPGAYDSHVEYLWNDINIISNAEQTTESLNAISTDVVSTYPFSPWGFWAGAALADRRAIWNAAKAYANATEGSDPGPRSTYRNYQDSSWVYWLPAGTATTDARLRSTTFSRFQGMANGVAGQRGGVAFPPALPTTPYNYSVITDGSRYNACGSSLTQLIPSTVLAPSGYDRNAGVVLNQQWARYEPWLNLTAVNTSGYPGSAAVDNVNGTNYVRGYLNFNGGVTPASWPDATQGAFRDANTNTVSTATFYRPIRVKHAVNSYAGWTDVKPDLGGYVYASKVLDPTVYPTAVLQNTLATYGVTSQISGQTWQVTALLGQSRHPIPV